MHSNANRWHEQKRMWRSLHGLRPTALDLSCVLHIRQHTRTELLSPGCIERLLYELGLNDECLHEFPVSHHTSCGKGLRVWQYPIQFGPYLEHLSRMGVQSYMELGIRHGGSYVATIEILERFCPLDFAVGVDIIPCPSMTAYKKLNPRSEFVCLNTRDDDFRKLVEQLAPIDLIFIDSHHQEDQCRSEFEGLKDFCNMIAFHDITNVDCPGVANVWDNVKSLDTYVCYEYTEQYDGLGPYMGIGLAIKKRRLLEADVCLEKEQQCKRTQQE